MPAAAGAGRLGAAWLRARRARGVRRRRGPGARPARVSIQLAGAGRAAAARLPR